MDMWFPTSQRSTDLVVLRPGRVSEFRSTSTFSSRGVRDNDPGSGGQLQRRVPEGEWSRREGGVRLRLRTGSTRSSNHEVSEFQWGTRLSPNDR